MPRPKEDEKKKSKSKKVDTADVPESGKLKKPASKTKDTDGSSKSRPTKDSSTGSLKGSSSKTTNGKEAKERWAWCCAAMSWGREDTQTPNVSAVAAVTDAGDAQLEAGCHTRRMFVRCGQRCGVMGLGSVWFDCSTSHLSCPQLSMWPYCHHGKVGNEVSASTIHVALSDLCLLSLTVQACQREDRCQDAGPPAPSQEGRRLHG